MSFKQWVEDTGDDQSFQTTNTEDPELNGLMRGLAHYKPAPKGKSKTSKKIDALFGKKTEGRVPSHGAGFVFTDGHAILLLLRNSNCEDRDTWDLPGGSIKDDETPREAAEREANEEMGGSQGKTFYTSVEDDGKWTFFFNKVKKRFTCQLNDEHTDWKWFRFGELRSPNIPLHPKVKEKISRYVYRIKKELEQ